MRCSTTNPACPSFRWNTGRFDAQRLEGADAANPQHDLLLNPSVPIAAVQACREIPVSWGVLVKIGVEQVDGHTAKPDAPDRHEDGAIAKRHRGDARPAVGGRRRLDRRIRPAQPLVAFLLPAVRGDMLVKVAFVGAHEADADKGHPEIPGLLAMIAGEDAGGRRRISAATDAMRTRRKSATRSPCPPSPDISKVHHVLRAARAASSASIAASANLRNSGFAAAASSVSAGMIHNIRTGLWAVARHSE